MDGCDAVVFTHLLKALARDPGEECVTVVQPGGDKGMDERLSRRAGGRRPEFGSGNFSDVGDMIFRAKMGVKFDPQISGERGRLNMMRYPSLTFENIHDYHLKAHFLLLLPNRRSTSLSFLDLLCTLVADHFHFLGNQKPLLKIVEQHFSQSKADCHY